jgi:hypothetical protein
LSYGAEIQIESREEIPAKSRSLYVERDGAFVLDVDGVADKWERLKAEVIYDL